MTTTSKFSFGKVCRINEESASRSSSARLKVESNAEIFGECINRLLSSNDLI